MKVWLLDTGPLVAYLDAADKDHSRVATELDASTGQLITTTAVIVDSSRRRR